MSVHIVDDEQQRYHPQPPCARVLHVAREPHTAEKTSSQKCGRATRPVPGEP